MILFLLSIVWGRILNILAYAFVNEHAPIAQTSTCLACHYSFLWYQRIPVISYCMLMGRCPHCRMLLSPVNPCIELLTGIALSLLYYSQAAAYFFSYSLFFSALIITIRTDIETMLIARLCTVGLIPVGIALSILKLLPISFYESLIGSVMGYLLLYGMMTFFSRLTGKQGLGLGDLDLLSFIGAFTGPFGCWISLLIGSTLGSIAGCLLMIITKRSKDVPIPFGPFLALGAMAYVLWQQDLLTLLFKQTF